MIRKNEIPELIMYKIGDKNIAYSLELAMFQELPDYPLKQPIKTFYHGEVNIINNAVDVKLSRSAMLAELDAELKKFNPNKVEAIYINSTNVCRGKCTYCYAMPFMINGDVVTFEHLMKSLELIDSIDTLKDITILGGEPLLNFALIKDILEKTNYSVSISTGLFVSDKEYQKLLDALKKYPDRIAIQCSLDPSNKWRPGKFQENIMPRAIELAKISKIFGIRATLCTKSYDYVQLRKEFEEATGKEIEVSFEIVSDETLIPTENELDILLALMVIDANDIIDGDRSEMPLNVVERSKQLVERFNMNDSNFYMARGCRLYVGDIPVLTPNTAKTTSFQRCTQVDMSQSPTSVAEKCKTCSILKYCGVSCPVEATQPGYCTTQTLKTLISVYIALGKYYGT